MTDTIFEMNDKGDVLFLHADMREALKALPENSVDSVVTDPPYHLQSIVKRFGAEDAAPAQFGKDGAFARASKGFMGKLWDGGDIAFQVDTWREVLRVLKPGGHLAAFGGTRTFHRMACAIEDAGFEIRDTLMYLYGVGFPKSHDVSKGIDKAAGVEREVVGPPRYSRGKTEQRYSETRKVSFDCDPQPVTAPATDAAKEWQGWGTALKPAVEPIILARKPLSTSPVNVRKNIEQQIRERGYAGEVEWVSNTNREKSASVESVAPLKATPESSKTPLSAETSAASADGSKITAIETKTSRSFAKVHAAITPSTGASISNERNDSTTRFVTKFYNTTETPAPVAESVNDPFLRSTTSKGVEVSPVEQSATKSAGNLSDSTFLLDTGSFVGIVTGLTGSMERVHIKRSGGKFVWPNALPEFVPAKPLTVAANVLRWRTGAINIDGCRVEVSTNDLQDMTGRSGKSTPNNVYGKNINGGGIKEGTWNPNRQGRWPANLIHDGSDEVVAMFPNTAPSRSGKPRSGKSGDGWGMSATGAEYDDSGSAARFFYAAKASRADRAGSRHPTIKPISLMRWLTRLITPPGGLVLDPFAGSGTTGAAALEEGMRCLLIEREAEYADDIRRRLSISDIGLI